jgi:hypothetical protein
MQVLTIPYLEGLLVVGILRASRSLSYTSGSVVLANISRARAHACKKPARDLSLQYNAIVCASACSALQGLGAEYVWAHVGNLLRPLYLGIHATPGCWPAICMLWPVSLLNRFLFAQEKDLARPFSFQHAYSHTWRLFERADSYGVQMGKRRIPEW